MANRDRWIKDQSEKCHIRIANLLMQGIQIPDVKTACPDDCFKLKKSFDVEILTEYGGQSEAGAKRNDKEGGDSFWENRQPSSKLKSSSYFKLQLGYRSKMATRRKLHLLKCQSSFKGYSETLKNSAQLVDEFAKHSSSTLPKGIPAAKSKTGNQALEQLGT